MATDKKQGSKAAPKAPTNMEKLGQAVVEGIRRGDIEIDRENPKEIKGPDITGREYSGKSISKNGMITILQQKDKKSRTPRYSVVVKDRTNKSLKQTITGAYARKAWALATKLPNVPRQDISEGDLKKASALI